jgi:hypothetical protein
LPQLRHLHLTFRLPPAAAELAGQLQQLQSLRLSIPVSTTSSSTPFKHAPAQVWQLSCLAMCRICRSSHDAPDAICKGEMWLVIDVYLGVERVQ